MSEQHREHAINQATDLIPLVPRIREIRAQYSDLETALYGKPWGTHELLDGWHGDIGDLFKLETACRGLRQFKIDSGRNLEEAVSHEIADNFFSWVAVADKTSVHPEAALQLAACQAPVRGTSRQLMVLFNLHAVNIDYLLDPPMLRQPKLGPETRRATLKRHFVEGMAALIELANIGEVDMPGAVTDTMDFLDERITAKLSQLKAAD